MSAINNVIDIHTRDSRCGYRRKDWPEVIDRGSLEAPTAHAASGYSNAPTLRKFSKVTRDPDHRF